MNTKDTPHTFLYRFESPVHYYIDLSTKDTVYYYFCLYIITYTQLTVPTLRVMSLSVKTVVNRNTHKHEIVAISALTHDSVNIEGDTLRPESKVCICKKYTSLVMRVQNLTSNAGTKSLSQ